MLVGVVPEGDTHRNGGCASEGNRDARASTSSLAMVRNKPIDGRSRLLAVDLAQPFLLGTLEHALNEMLGHMIVHALHTQCDGHGSRAAAGNFGALEPRQGQVRVRTAVPDAS